VLFSSLSSADGATYRAGIPQSFSVMRPNFKRFFAFLCAALVCPQRFSLGGFSTTAEDAGGFTERLREI
jgi:hypothetical protein